MTVLKIYIKTCRKCQPRENCVVHLIHISAVSWVNWGHYNFKYGFVINSKRKAICFFSWQLTFSEYSANVPFKCIWVVISIPEVWGRGQPMLSQCCFLQATYKKRKLWSWQTFYMLGNLSSGSLPKSYKRRHQVLKRIVVHEQSNCPLWQQKREW